MMRRAWTAGVAAALAVTGMVGGFARPAQAELVEGECTGTVSFRKGTESGGPFSVDAAAEKGGVYVVPLSDDVDWEASTPARSGPYSGWVEFALPFPFGGLRLDEWTGEVQKGSNSGTTSYDLPDALPRGVEFMVRAEHEDSEGLCVGTLRLKLEGEAFGNWYAWGALGLALLLAVAFLGSAGLLRRGSGERARSVGRAVLSAGVGVVFGAVLGLALVMMGLTPVDSVVPFAMGLLFLVLGALLGGGIVRRGRRVSMGKRDSTGKPDAAGKPEPGTRPAGTGTPESGGKPFSAGRRDQEETE